jgi:FG-GAP repeat
VGVPGENQGRGVAQVLVGSAAGLTAAGSQLWSQDSRGVAGQAEGSDRFGSALAAGDFNADGRADLAVGVPGETLGGAFGAGAVNVLYGSAGGLTAAGSQLWSPSHPWGGRGR